MAHPQASVRDRDIAYLIFRICLGLNIFLHGVVRLGGHYEQFVQDTVQKFEGSGLPLWGVHSFAHSIPILESIFGLLLVMGFATRWIAIAGVALMALLMFGMSVLQKWEIVGLQMNYIFFYFLILFLLEHNVYSLDNLIHRRQ